MSEDRTKTVPSKKIDTDKKTKKVAEITRVEFLDKDGNKKNVFQTEEKMKVVVYNKVKKEITDPIFGIVIKEVFNKVPVFVTNTKFMGVSTGKIGIGERKVVYVIDNFLATGEYTVSPAISDKHAKVFYDWKESMATIKVVNLKFNSAALADLPHSIEI